MHRTNFARSLSQKSRDSNSIHDENSSSHRYSDDLLQEIRGLQRQIYSDFSSTLSPFSPITPGSSHSSVPTHRFGLSGKVLERAHQIPERFWLDWHEKQRRERIEQLESMKNQYDQMNRSRSRPTNLNLSSTTGRRRSLVLLHQRAFPESTISRINSSEQQSPKTFKSINCRIPTDSLNSLDNVADIDTELNLTVLCQQKNSRIYPSLYSSGILRRSVTFRSMR